MKKWKPRVEGNEVKISDDKCRQRVDEGGKGDLLKRRSIWACEEIKIKMHKVSDIDLKNLLADLWEILLPTPSQPYLSFQVAPIRNSERLSNSNRRTRR